MKGHILASLQGNIRRVKQLHYGGQQQVKVVIQVGAEELDRVEELQRHTDRNRQKQVRGSKCRVT